MNPKLLTAFALVFLLQNANASEDNSFSINQKNIRLMPLAKRALDQKKPEEAKNLLETMLQLEPNNAMAHLYLGQAYALEKDYINARKELLYCLNFKDQVEITEAAQQALQKLPKRFRSIKTTNLLSNDAQAVKTDHH